jgi:molybdate transport system permease protein
MAGVALALARALGEFGATLMIAGNLPGRTQTMSIAIFDAVQTGRTGDAQVLAITLSFVSVGLLVAVGLGAQRRAT